MSEFSVSNFLTFVSTKGLARQNRFLVQINNIDFSFDMGGRELALMCQSASLPGATVVTRTQSIFGPNYVRPASINYGDNISMSFLCDKDMAVRKLFDDWIHQVVNASSFTVNYKERYARDIVISQIDESENPTYSIKLIDAFPIQIGALALNQSALDRFHVLPVTFSYRYWETGRVSNSEIFDLFTVGPSELTKEWGPKIPLPSLNRDPAQPVNAENIGEVGSAGPGRATTGGGNLSDFGLG